MIIMSHIDAILDLPVDRRHNISDLKADTAHLDKILLVKATTRHFHLRAAVVTNNSPNLLFWLFLKHLVN